MAFVDLREEALQYGRGVLSTYRMAPDDRDDLILDLLTAKLAWILNAESPCAYFRVALRHSALDLLDERRVIVDTPPAEDGSTFTIDSAVPTPSPERLIILIEEEREAVHAERERVEKQLETIESMNMAHRDFLEAMPRRDRIIVEAIARGENRDELAATLGMLRNSIDQIVSRTRRRFEKAQS